MKLFLCLFLLMTTAHSKVWNHTETWNEEWEAKYSSWIENDLSRDLFVNPTSAYKGIETECADSVYALRIIFSYENNLPFKINNPIAHLKRSYSTVSNTWRRFDHISDPTERVVAFIKFLLPHVGVYSLGKDTYPIHPKDIKSGDLFLTRWLSRGHSVRHSYTIRKIYASGYMKLTYSTVPIRARKLLEIDGMPLTVFPNDSEMYSYGFRRFKWPRYVRNHTTGHIGKSNFQFDLRKRVSAEVYFEEIRKFLKKREEYIGEKIGRYFVNICHMMETRQDNVLDALELQESIGNRCVNYREFDLYSTPSKDQKIYKMINEMIGLWEQAVEEGEFYELSFERQLALDALIGNDETDFAHEQLERQCNIDILNNENINMKSFFLAYEEGKISSHPNDGMLARWGLADHQERCEKFY